jgi:outer membrane protein assembly factor BamB
MELNIRLARGRAGLAGVSVFTACVACAAFAGDQPQWGQKFNRNQVSPETGLPDAFDPKSDANVKWVAPLGTHSYCTPIVADGRVYIGTNNERPRDPKHRGDRAVLMCLNERDGRLLWQLVVPKLSADLDDPYLDWPEIGHSSEPTIEGDRAYTLTNRGEIVCLDVRGFANGNDGPYRDEAAHLAPRGQPPIEPGPADADIVWLCDLRAEAGIRTHDQVHGSILIDGDLLYVNSCNGVDSTHRKIQTPDAPSLVVLNKRTGKIVARDRLGLGPKTFHCTWSSPSLGVVNGKKLVFFGGPDGVCYAFDALDGPPADAGVATLNNVWRFDCDPDAPKGNGNVHLFVQNRREGPSEILGMPVFDGGRVYVAAGGDLWWGKRRSVLKCIDAGGTGDVTRTAQVWSYDMPRETCTTPSVYDGMVFAADCGGNIHCVDAATGKGLWTHKADGDIWGSPLVADGKVYVGTRRAEFVVLAAAREKKVLSSAHLGDGELVNGTVTAANGVLYVPTMTRLFALQVPAAARAEPGR